MSNSMAVGKVAEFWRVLRDVNPDSVRREMERGFTLALLGNEERGREAVRRALRPADGHEIGEYLLELAEVGTMAERALPPRADLYLYVVDAACGLSGADISALEQLYLMARPTALVFAGEGCETLAGEMEQVSRDLGGLVSQTLAIDPADQDNVDRVVTAALVRALPTRALALARSVKNVRAEVVDILIAETSRVNAEFALLSNLPANVPILGTVLGTGADLVVLTKNQTMLVLKLAAIYGRDLGRKWRLAGEVVPVVGAAFAWRSVARLLVGMLPSPVAALPKTAIAYAGTYVVGKMARFYYENGHRPSQRETQQFAEAAAQDWRRALSETAG
ncbi:MAG: hypothetical protein M1401_05455 [Chloroflexi bacterium]|nr:hypothetical protein [Chloroflexota bacterium]